MSAMVCLETVIATRWSSRNFKVLAMVGSTLSIFVFFYGLLTLSVRCFGLVSESACAGGGLGLSSSLSWRMPSGTLFGYPFVARL